MERVAGGGAPGLGLGALRELAGRHGIRPSKALGQHFLADPNLSRRIASLAEIRPGDRVLEVGTGLGSLTVALAEAGAEVLTVEFDRRLAPALAEVLAPHPRVRLLQGDALRLDWTATLGEGDWKMVSNLPYNVAVPLVLDLLEKAPQVRDYLVMVQREVGERLAAGPGEDAYGAVSVRVTYWAESRLLRRVPASVFWPEPKVESVLVRLTPREPPVSTPPDRLFLLVGEGFAQRRKTMRSALSRLGLPAAQAKEVLAACGLDANVRAEQLGVKEFACLTDGVFGDG